jgi:hypothetical protein
LRGACAAGGFHMTFDAPRALRDMGNSDSDDLLGARIKRALGEYRLRECAEGVVGLRCKGVA